MALHPLKWFIKISRGMGLAGDGRGMKEFVIRALRLGRHGWGTNALLRFFYEEGTLLKALKPSLWSQAVCFCHDLDETTSE